LVGKRLPQGCKIACPVGHELTFKFNIRMPPLFSCRYFKKSDKFEWGSIITDYHRMALGLILLATDMSIGY
jgi:hypothetical protein